MESRQSFVNRIFALSNEIEERELLYPEFTQPSLQQSNENSEVNSPVFLFAQGDSSSVEDKSSSRSVDGGDKADSSASMSDSNSEVISPRKKQKTTHGNDDCAPQSTGRHTWTNKDNIALISFIEQQMSKVSRSLYQKAQHIEDKQSDAYKAAIHTSWANFTKLCKDEIDARAATERLEFPSFSSYSSLVTKLKRCYEKGSSMIAKQMRATTGQTMAFNAVDTAYMKYVELEDDFHRDHVQDRPSQQQLEDEEEKVRQNRHRELTKDRRNATSKDQADDENGVLNTSIEKMGSMIKDVLSGEISVSLAGESATKKDVENLKSEMANLKSDIGNIKSDMGEIKKLLELVVKRG